MSERGISRTAIWVAAARAIGAREPDEQARNPDWLAERLLGDPAQIDLDHAVVDALGQSYEAAMQEMDVASTVRAMAERTRFIDAALQRAVARGVTQVLVLGAGLDSHAYRFQELLADSRVFELDRPETQAYKRRRVDSVLGGSPANLAYVPADLEHEGLATVLARHGYDPSRKTFIIMEGVTMYVLEEPLRETFRYVASHAPGSSIVFDFATRAAVDGFRQMDVSRLPESVRLSVQRFLNMIRDEPWVFGIPLDAERDFLAGLGLELGEILTIGSEESIARYLTRADGTTIGAEAHEKSLALRRSLQERALGALGAEQRARIEATMREQARQNAYRIAEAMVEGGA